MAMTKKRAAEIARGLPDRLTANKLAPTIGYMDMGDYALTVSINKEDGRYVSNVSGLYSKGQGEHQVSNDGTHGYQSHPLPFHLLYKETKEGYTRLPYTKIEDIIYNLASQMEQQVYQRMLKAEKEYKQYQQSTKIPEVTKKTEQQVAALRRIHGLPVGNDNLFKDDLDISTRNGYTTTLRGTLKTQYQNLTKDVLYEFIRRHGVVEHVFLVRDTDKGRQVIYEYEFFA